LYLNIKTTSFSYCTIKNICFPLHTKNLKLHLMILKTKYVLIKQEVIVYICVRAPDGTASNDFVNIKTKKYNLKKQ